MSMNQNDDIRYLDIGLPEDIARLKAIGDFENAIRLIDMRLSDPKTTAPLAACMPGAAGNYAAPATELSLHL